MRKSQTGPATDHYLAVDPYHDSLDLNLDLSTSKVHQTWIASDSAHALAGHSQTSMFSVNDVETE